MVQPMNAFPTQVGKLRSISKVHINVKGRNHSQKLFSQFSWYQMHHVSFPSREATKNLPSHNYEPHQQPTWHSNPTVQQWYIYLTVTSNLLIVTNNSLIGLKTCSIRRRPGLVLKTQQLLSGSEVIVSGEQSITPNVLNQHNA